MQKNAEIQYFILICRMLATNYVGAFCLTKVLLPLLKNSPIASRVVNVTSFTHRNGKTFTRTMDIYGILFFSLSFFFPQFAAGRPTETPFPGNSL